MNKEENKNNKNFILVIMLAIFILLPVNGFSQIQTISYTSNTGLTNNQQAYLNLNLVKMTPHPVRPGDNVLIWLNLENTGKTNATNVRIIPVNQYPFENAQILIGNYSTIPGITAIEQTQLYSNTGTTPQNFVLSKLLIKISPNTNPGIYNLPIRVEYNNQISQIFQIPIYVNQTQTKFESQITKSNQFTTTFSIQNIGNNTAKSITLTIPQDMNSNLNIQGPSTVYLGNLQPGDFSNVYFNINNPKTQNITYTISYTDINGNRQTIIQTKQLPESKTESLTINTQSTTQELLLIGVGFLIGIIFILIFTVKTKKKEKQNENSK